MINHFLNMLFVKRCIACRTLMPYDSKDCLCDTCLPKWELEKSEVCSVCLKRQTRCSCGFGRSELDGVRHLAMYSNGDNESVAKRLVFALKKKKDSRAFDFLAKEIVDNLIDKNISSDTVVVNVPRNPNSINEIGYDHARVLAKKVAMLLDVKYADVLAQKRNKKEQKRLNSMQRMENARKNFYYETSGKIKIDGCNVVLVDDIGTTGATVKVCAELLKENGAKSVKAVLVAKNRFINKKV